MECIAACPREGNAFAFAPALPAGRPYDPGRRQALLAIGAGVAGVAVLRAGGLGLHDHPQSRIVAMSFCEPRSWTRVLSS